MKVAYPKWIYSKSGSKLVHSEEEHQAAGEGWYESPALIPADVPLQPVAPAPAPAPEPEPDKPAPPTRADLLAQADELGIKIDRRWSDERLLSEINAALNK